VAIGDRILDTLVAFFVGSAVRSLAIGTALLWLGAHYLRWWTAVLVMAGAAWELVAYPGRLP
jgi:hypothetical protein